ncbi:hypothetical protein GH741_06680 [Aquibacillus halophilus]|uniref:Helicase Helix-turn-helix domain-containing protein n=1 Tax=Aquibacillus halophilus TaxID=930132 RepID=A0A6A8DCW2_9BACI|nr:helix-turn-helix domain-containing protein [Aquibacillus halophilus]MRH42366.1 hypothetical protein [Aquibacillus halophilus]
MFTLLLLDCVDRFKGERSISAVYHLLTGKRSAQTLQDAHMYKLSHYFGVYKSLDRNDFRNFIIQLRDQGYIAGNDEVASLTRNGKELFHKENSVERLKEFNGINYNRMTHLCIQRLKLFVQTVTNIEAGNHTFIAINDNKEIQGWVRKLYYKNKSDLKLCLNRLYQELYTFLKGLEELEATIFVERFTGSSSVGLSKEQISRRYNLTFHDVEIKTELINHKLISFIIKNKQHVPLLAEFIEDLTNYLFMTESAEKSYQLLSQGHSVEEIAKIRHLKVNTIHDHLVEIAYIDNEYDLSKFISNEGVEQIKTCITNLKTRKLKVIKEDLQNRYSFFQIRLVLAIHPPDVKEKQENGQ